MTKFEKCTAKVDASFKTSRQFVPSTVLSRRKPSPPGKKAHTTQRNSCVSHSDPTTTTNITATNISGSGDTRSTTTQ